METVQSFDVPNSTMTSTRADNDNSLHSGGPPSPVRRSAFPEEAVARIFKPSRSVMTSARTRPDWRLVFERRTAPFIEPLMGYTGGKDTLIQVELSFPTLEAAIRYAERQGLRYVVQGARSPSRGDTAHEQGSREKKAFSEMVWSRLQLAWLQASHGYVAGAPALQQAVLSEPEAFYASPMEVVQDPVLAPDEKLTVLKNWAWNEYLIDLATAEGMPENARPARLHDVELALLALESNITVANVNAGAAQGRMAA